MNALIQRTLELEWGYIMATLIIRFVGVFVVLAILLVAMQILGKIVSRIVADREAKTPERQEEDTPPITLADAPEQEVGEEELVAAMGAAIAFAMESEQRAVAPLTHAGITAGSWAMAGRSAMMNARLQAGSQRRSS